MVMNSGQKTGRRLKIELMFKDRVGIVAEATAIIAEKGLNIISMEVQKAEDRAFVYLEMEKTSAGGSDQELFACLGRLHNCLELKKIHTLPHEKREQAYKVVLDSVSDGILSIDENGILTTINRVACRILNCEEQAVVGHSMSKLELPDTCLNDAFNQRHFSSEKRNIITDKGRFQYFATCKPIKDTTGRIMGAIEIIKDLKEIEALANAVSQPTQITFSDIIGTSAGIKEVILLAAKIARTESIVSIRGESGTGKELFARAIHAESRRKGPFIAINCAALPESLLESELFGYEGGAFTGARRQGKAGLFEIAAEGSVFLDEIAEMPIKVQAKMLRLIQEKQVRRIGGGAEIPIHVRIITATNRNLERLVEEKQFREDLYYRINVLPIHIPPLRRRPEDIALLTDHFLYQLSAHFQKKPQQLTSDALEKLNRHDWPGNVRELRNLIERAAILSSSEVIDKESILFSFEVGKGFAGLTATTDLGIQSLRNLVDRYEKDVLAEALRQSLSIRQTAAKLKISHTTLMNKIRKHNLTPANK
jgi:TyrR family helix-turn-helix protein/PAS domain S-box-containing protein